MPAVIEHPIDIQQDTGGPSLPPPPERGGGDWDPRPHGRPNNRLKRYRVGLFFAVVSIYTLFIALTSAYVVRQSGGRFDPNTAETIHDWVAIQLPSILWINTVLLIISSFTIEFARRQVFSEALIMDEWLGLDRSTRKASLPWIGVTVILGFGFLAGQFLAWRELNEQGVYAASNAASSFFFILTAAHAIHLFGGLASLLWAAVAGVAMSLQSRQIATDITAWHWHAMGVLWIYIFALLYWLR